MSVRRLLEEMDSAREAWRAEAAATRASGRQLYSSAGGPLLRNSVVTYLDELGAKERIEAMTTEDLRREIDRRDELAERLHSAFDQDRQRIISFSDNVAVAIPLPDDTPASLVAEVAWRADACASYQLGTLAEGTCMRGGIAAGLAYCDQQLIEGPALLKAIELEEVHADAPRVLIAEPIVDHLRATAPPTRRPWPDHLYVVDEADDRVFVNYLLAGKPGGHDRSISRHRDVVTKQVSEHPRRSRAWLKWYWISRYHNWFIDHHRLDASFKVAGSPSGTFHIL